MEHDKNKKKEIQIYNLEFPPYITEFHIGDYKFKRSSDYDKAFGKMMHLVNSIGSEHRTKVQTGEHQITAIVELPEEEKKCVLPWEDKKLTQLYDIILLLTLFTGRNVFLKNWEEDENTAIISDHRAFNYGGQLELSLKHESMWKHEDTGELKTEKEMKGIPIFKYNQINVGFEKGLNQVLKHISSDQWQEIYKGGYFLFLYRDMVQRQILERSFLTGWTIWEQIFSLENSRWLTDRDIFKMSGENKIAYVLNKYFSVDLDETGWKNTKRLTRSRNRLVHFGRKMENVSNKEKEMFIRLTEQLMACILNLEPNNVFNSFERLYDFLKTI